MSSWRARQGFMLVLLVASALALIAQQSGAGGDPFQQRVPGLTLRHQTIADAVAQLSQSTALSYSVELKLGASIEQPAPSLVKLDATLPPGSLSGILDALCALDQSFTWSSFGTAVNVYPKKLVDDPHYLLNRRIPVLSLKDARKADQAVFAVVEQLPGAKEQIAVLGSGVSLSFAAPWTATFTDITVREVFDKIAQHLGPTYGWQFGGAADFRIITFHERLVAKPPASVP